MACGTLASSAHAKAVLFHGGVCRRGLCGNMKTAVDAIFVGKARQYTRGLLPVCPHHLIEPAHQYPTDPPPEVSLFHLAVSVTSGYQGMLIVLPSEHWTV
jgi:hypothetical protein